MPQKFTGSLEVNRKNLSVALALKLALYADLATGNDLNQMRL